MRFSKLYLLSQSEQRALRVLFVDKPAVIKGANGMGKSAVIKSLYDAFGAEPHQIDRPWKGAGVAAAVQFSVGGADYTILKVAGTYAVFDSNVKQLIRTSRVGSELAPFLANLLHFKLVMADREDKTVIPPPSYIFAPFYIDQDQGWVKSWTSFDRMYLPKSRRLLAEYHSGLKPNEYYVALAERDRLRADWNESHRERAALDQTFRRFRETVSTLTLNYDLDEFIEESRQLASESTNLHNEQLKYKRSLADMHQERLLWKNQLNIVEAALSEMRSSFQIALDEPADIECPTCGAHYENSIAERFTLIEDVDGLTAALMVANEKLREVESTIEAKMGGLGRIEASIRRVDSILALRRAELTFRDIVRAEGRNEASRIFHERLAVVDQEVLSKQREVDQQTALMEQATNRRRSQEINGFFSDKLAEFSAVLDVRVRDSSALRVSSSMQARGSELPRALLAYYYAFLHTSAAHSSAAFCPIVIDAPNQQGQDEEHMPTIMRFLVKEAPPGSQIIVAAENLFGLSEDDVDVIEVGEAKNQVLRREEFASVLEEMRPFLGALI